MMHRVKKILNFQKALTGYFEKIKAPMYGLSQYIIKLGSVFIYLCSLLTLFFQWLWLLYWYPWIWKAKKGSAIDLWISDLAIDQWNSSLVQLYHVTYRISANSFCRNYWRGELFKGGNYSRKYGSWTKSFHHSIRSEIQSYWYYRPVASGGAPHFLADQ